jgi:hypothetical protein
VSESAERETKTVEQYDGNIDAAKLLQAGSAIAK